MHRDHDVFIEAIHTREKVRLTFYSKEDEQPLCRKCAPMDFGPSRRAKQKNDRYHFWDYESDTGQHPLSLDPEEVIVIEPIEESFDPAEFITWDTKASPWFVSRDWGPFS